MRVNTRVAFDAWLNGKDCRKAESVWSNGRDVYSYRTCLLTRTPEGRAIMNDTRYSVTTSIQQGGLRTALRLAGIEYDTVTGIPFGASDLSLTAALAK